MFLELIELLGMIYLFLWFILPFVFVFSVIYAISDIIKEKNPIIKIIIASISLLLILSGIMSMIISIPN